MMLLLQCFSEGSLSSWAPTLFPNCKRKIDLEGSELEAALKSELRSITP